MSASSLDRWDRWTAAGVLFAGVAALVALPFTLPKPGGGDDAARDAKASQRAGGTIKLGAKLAVLYGIGSDVARARQWQPRLTVYGRVVPNPGAASEIRAPFAGTVKAPAQGWPAVGRRVAAGQELAIVQARFSPQERLDLEAKAAEAREKVKGAEDVLQVQEERVKRLNPLTGVMPRTEFDLALVQRAEARAARAGAAAQARLWQEALASLDKRAIALTLSAPLDGEVIEILAQPGTLVEAGAVLLKLVDYRRVLLRLDVLAGRGTPPAELTVLLASTDGETRATLPARRSGVAPNVDPASQYAGYFYEAEGPESEGTWRPGLFVEAAVADSTAAIVPAVAVPASALLYHQGRALVYAEIGPGRYERREVHVLGREGEWALLGRGVRDGEKVVTRHAQVLLSEEFRGDADDD